MSKGRPKMFTGAAEKRVAKLIEKHGLMGTQEILAEKGVQVAPGKKAKKMDVSITALSTVAKNNGIELQRGRRAA